MPFPLLSAPQYVSWNYTYRCNLNCDHCYSRSRLYPAELSEDDYKAVAQQLIDASVFTVAFGGGEPILRRDCVSTIEVLASAGIDVHLTTSGWSMTRLTAERLQAAGLGTLFVSVDSATESLHDSFRRREGAFRRALNALREAAYVGLRTRLSTVVSRLNIGDLEPIAHLALEYGAAGVEFKRFRPSGNGLLSREKWELTGADLEESRIRIEGLNNSLDTDIVLIDNEKEENTPCPCGRRSICIRPNGDVTPCPYVERVVGNLMDAPLLEVWRHSGPLCQFRVGTDCAALLGASSPSNPGLSLTVP
jgi:MoaA/NifB/PqqE/SkfB family radical SAM enzyme